MLISYSTHPSLGTLSSRRGPPKAACPQGLGWQCFHPVGEASCSQSVTGPPAWSGAREEKAGLPGEGEEGAGVPFLTISQWFLRKKWSHPGLTSSAPPHQVIIICLVILDSLLVLAELLLDLRIIEPDKKDYAVKVCTWCGHACGTGAKVVQAHTWCRCTPAHPSHACTRSGLQAARAYIGPCG